MNLGYVDKLGICLNLYDRNKSQELKRVNPDRNMCNLGKGREVGNIKLSWEFVVKLRI